MRLPGDDPRAAQLELLNEIARIATLDLELRPMLQRITDTLAMKLDCEFVALVTIHGDRFLCEALTSQFETSVYVGYGRELGSGVVGAVAATGEAIVIDDVREFPNYVETLPGGAAEICVPVNHHGQIVAILNLESMRIGAFRGHEKLIETVADQISGAIASAQSHAAMRAMMVQLEEKTKALEEANAHLANAIETLHRISTQDGLTGLSNRRHFDETLALECRRAARTQASISLLMLDIDYFKPFNDAHGHQAGDELLRRVAQMLQETVHRAADLVARYGGEEFVVLLPETNAEDAHRIAETLRARIAGSGTVTVSIGVATLVPPRDGSACAEIVRRADERLYEAKRAGRNRVC